ncbi:unnamed protein product [Amoebophrya sp. A120]|nr:unnamed protein product [Amoebophrya sp. A120]|eukprot:GSA120T00015538001.1
MCRFAAMWSNEPILIADILTKPRMSLIRQSYAAQERQHPIGIPGLSYQQSTLNGDGYGIAWYRDVDEQFPCDPFLCEPVVSSRDVEGHDGVLAESSTKKISNSGTQQEREYPPLVSGSGRGAPKSSEDVDADPVSSCTKTRSKNVAGTKNLNLNPPTATSSASARSKPTTKIPCVFTSLKPAWNDRNLSRLAEQVSSKCVFAHIRAAGPGSPVSDDACHPFEARGILFMHNGMLGDFDKHCRTLMSMLSEEGFKVALEHNCIDSAVAFGLFLTILDRNDYAATVSGGRSAADSGCPPAPLDGAAQQGTTTTSGDEEEDDMVDDQSYNHGSTKSKNTKRKNQSCVEESTTTKNTTSTKNLFSTAELADALQQTIDVLNTVCGPKAPSLLNFVISHGTCLLATRAGVGGEGASLYVCTGSDWVQETKKQCPKKPKSRITQKQEKSWGHDLGENFQKDFSMVNMEARPSVVIIASEPLSADRHDWIPVPSNTLVAVTTLFCVKEKARQIESVLFLPLSGDDAERPVSSCGEQSSMQELKGRGTRGHTAGARDDNAGRWANKIIRSPHEDNENQRSRQCQTRQRWPPDQDPDHLSQPPLFRAARLGAVLAAMQGQSRQEMPPHRSRDDVVHDQEERPRRPDMSIDRSPGEDVQHVTVANSAEQHVESHRSRCPSSEQTKSHAALSPAQLSGDEEGASAWPKTQQDVKNAGPPLSRPMDVETAASDVLANHGDSDSQRLYAEALLEVFRQQTYQATQQQVRKIEDGNNDVFIHPGAANDTAGRCSSSFPSTIFSPSAQEQNFFSTSPRPPARPLFIPQDEKLQIQRTRNKNLISRSKYFAMPTGVRNCVIWRQRYLLAGCLDGSIRVVNLISGKKNEESERDTTSHEQRTSSPRDIQNIKHQADEQAGPTEDHFSPDQNQYRILGHNAAPILALRIFRDRYLLSSSKMDLRIWDLDFLESCTTSRSTVELQEAQERPGRGGVVSHHAAHTNGGGREPTSAPTTIGVPPPLPFGGPGAASAEVTDSVTSETADESVLTLPNSAFHYAGAASTCTTTSTSELQPPRLQPIISQRSVTDTSGLVFRPGETVSVVVPGTTTVGSSFSKEVINGTSVLTGAAATTSTATMTALSSASPRELRKASKRNLNTNYGGNTNSSSSTTLTNKLQPGAATTSSTTDSSLTMNAACVVCYRFAPLQGQLLTIGRCDEGGVDEGRFRITLGFSSCNVFELSVDLDTLRKHPQRSNTIRFFTLPCPTSRTEDLRKCYPLWTTLNKSNFFMLSNTTPALDVDVPLLPTYNFDSPQLKGIVAPSGSGGGGGGSTSTHQTNTGETSTTSGAQEVTADPGVFSSPQAPSTQTSQLGNVPGLTQELPSLDEDCSFLLQKTVSEIASSPYSTASPPGLQGLRRGAATTSQRRTTTANKVTGGGAGVVPPAQLPKDCQQLRFIAQHRSCVYQVCYLPHNKMALSVGGDGVLKVHYVAENGQTFACRDELQGRDGPIYSAAVCVNLKKKNTAATSNCLHRGRNKLVTRRFTDEGCFDSYTCTGGTMEEGDVEQQQGGVLGGSAALHDEKENHCDQQNKSGNFISCTISKGVLGNNAVSAATSSGSKTKTRADAIITKNITSKKFILDGTTSPVSATARQRVVGTNNGNVVSTTTLGAGELAKAPSHPEFRLSIVEEMVEQKSGFLLHGEDALAEYGQQKNMIDVETEEDHKLLTPRSVVEEETSSTDITTAQAVSGGKINRDLHEKKNETSHNLASEPSTSSSTGELPGGGESSSSSAPAPGGSVSLTMHSHINQVPTTTPAMQQTTATQAIEDIFVTGDESGKIKLWRVLNGSLSFMSELLDTNARTSPSHQSRSRVLSLCVLRETLLVAGRGDGSLELYDLRKRQLLEVYQNVSRGGRWAWEDTSSAQRMNNTTNHVCQCIRRIDDWQFCCISQDQGVTLFTVGEQEEKLEVQESELMVVPGSNHATREQKSDQQLHKHLLNAADAASCSTSAISGRAPPGASEQAAPLLLPPKNTSSSKDNPRGLRYFLCEADSIAQLVKFLAAMENARRTRKFEILSTENRRACFLLELDDEEEKIFADGAGGAITPGQGLLGVDEESSANRTAVTAKSTVFVRLFRDATDLVRSLIDDHSSRDSSGTAQTCNAHLLRVTELLF